MFSFFKKKEPKEPAYLTITDTNFNEIVAKAKQPVLLDFWAAWCGPCKVIGPIIEELAEDFEGRAIVGKVNVDGNPKLSSFFKVKSIPTLMFIANGQVHERFAGLVPKPNLAEILEEYIVMMKEQPEQENSEEE